MTETGKLVELIEQVTGSMNTLEQLLDDEVDRRIHHPEELTLAVAQCLEAQYAVTDLLPRLRAARRTLRRVRQVIVSETSPLAAAVADGV